MPQKNLQGHERTAPVVVFDTFLFVQFPLVFLQCFSDGI